MRYPGQWQDIRSFVRPLDPGVLGIYRETGADVWACLDWVCRNISYRSDNGEWWGFPAETIKRGFGDCDDSSILLASLLNNFTNAYVAVGSYRGLGHAWCQLNGTILEGTYGSARTVPDPQNYVTYALFNDREVIEVWPGALSELFHLERREPTKLALMAQALQAPDWAALATPLALGFIGSLLAGIIVSAVIRETRETRL